MNCSFCQKNIENKGSLVAHETTCPNNPSRISFSRGQGAGRQKGSVPWSKGKKCPEITRRYEKLYPYEDVLIENSTYARHSLKARLIKDQLIQYKCDVCGLGPMWCDKPMPLILDHINGINNDNRIENLRFVCSNCDAQLPTYKARNKRKVASKVDKQI